MVSIGTTARKLRQTLEWTQLETAEALGVSNVHLCNVEKNKTQPSQSLLDRYRKLWGIDLYVLTWCENGDVEELPRAVHIAASKLATAWQKRIDDLVEEQRKESDTPCLISDK